MAGANGVEKRLTCDREERIHLKGISPEYYSRFVNPGPSPANNLVDPVKNVLNPQLLRYPFLAPILPTSGVLDAQQVTNDMLWDGTVANALTTPSAAVIAAYVGQRFLTSLGIGTLGATPATPLQNELDGFTTTVENSDAVNTKTITFGAGITPATIAFLPSTISVVRWEFTRNDPPALRVYVLSVDSSITGLPVTNPPIPGVFPQGILVETTAPSGGAIVGRTLVSTDPELVVTNGNGVAGNPSLAINLTPVGKLLGGTVQTDVNYLGEVYNAGNGFSVSASADQSVVSGPGSAATSPVTQFNVNSANDYNDGNWNNVTGTYIVPTSGRWLFGANLLLESNATTVGSFLAWNSIGSHEIPIMAVGNDDSWGFSTLPHLVAGTVCQLNIGTVAGSFTTTLEAGSTIFGRLMQPDA